MGGCAQERKGGLLFDLAGKDGLTLLKKKSLLGRVESGLAAVDMCQFVGCFDGVPLSPRLQSTGRDACCWLTKA